ncbi:glycosyltransferase family 2 protein [Massilibacteroides sp.]|uniref:glycosyltransferase family 2 protein n=1 Tax=Massilibacteroides sp. TaxID=2034766 RepID=UPI00263232EC|nr:glycosyltransferase family 2 protein [Massilibacteroides sp.]MDD4516083.1 glycosyltransferase family 2 protein [Massilibacteroides sp.]
MIKLAVVILNWNGKALMEEFLPSVVENTPQEQAEIVVADNGSTDGSVDMLKKKFPQIRLILLDKNYGFAEGYNQALKQVDTQYTVLLNSDVEVTPGWIDAPLKMLENEKNIAGIQPKILSQRNKEYFEYAGAAGGFMDRYGYPYCRGRVLHAIEKDLGQYDIPIDILWASGACFFIRTEVYKKEGGLDGQFFAHQEEIDLCWRLRSRGYRLMCTPASVVYHVGGATLNAESPHKTYLNFRNNLLMVYKNLPEADLKHVMKVRFWLDYLAALKFLLTGHKENAKAIYKARQEFFQMKESYTPIREENLKKTVLSIIPELLRRSLIVSFYFKRRHRFLTV